MNEQPKIEPDTDDDEVMCWCSGTTRGEICALFKQGKDLEGISRYTGALSGCGGCEWEIGELIEALRLEQTVTSNEEGVVGQHANGSAPANEV